MVEIRTCIKCGKIKPLSEYRFRKEVGLYRRDCKQCGREKNKEYNKNNREKRRENAREYRKNNPEKMRENAKKHYHENKEYYYIKLKLWKEKNPDYTKEYSREYRKNNTDRLKEWQREYQRIKYHSNINYKLRMLIGGRIRRVLNQSRVNKNNTTLELLGCSFRELKEHIENNFKKDMSWNLLYKGEIHIDHIQPCASFDLTDPEQQKQCFHYSNLQPLWAEENHKKGAKWQAVSA